MIESVSATIIILAFLVLFAVVIPVCGCIPKIKETISLRWLVVVVFLACMIGVIINYRELDTEIKRIVVIGAAILSGLYLAVRSVEKWLFNGFISGRRIEAQVQKGDLAAKVVIDKKDQGLNQDQNRKGLEELARREQQ